MASYVSLIFFVSALISPLTLTPPFPPNDTMDTLRPLFSRRSEAVSFPAQSLPFTTSTANTIDSGVPQEVTAKLHELVRLWNRPDPKVKEKRKRGRGGDPKGKGKGKGREGGEGGNAGVGGIGPTSLRSGRLLHQGLEQEVKSEQPDASRPGTITTWLHGTVDEVLVRSSISSPCIRKSHDPAIRQRTRHRPRHRQEGAKGS